MISNDFKNCLKKVVEEDNFIKIKTNSIMHDLKLKILNKQIKPENRVKAVEYEFNELIQEFEHRMNELQNKYKSLNENYCQKLTEAKTMVEESERRLLEGNSKAQ